MKSLDQLRDHWSEKFLQEVLPAVYKAMDEAKITYSEDQLENMANDAFKAGFDIAIELQQESQKKARIFWIRDNKKEYGETAMPDFSVFSFSEGVEGNLIKVREVIE